MKREDIKKLLPEAEDGLIDQIMDLHSKDVGTLKQNVESLTTERNTLQKQLTEANTQIQGFKDLDVEGIKQKAAEWETKYNTDTKALKEQLETVKYGHTVEKSAEGLKFSSGAAKKQFVADLTAKKLPEQEGKLLGFDDFLKAYRESDPDAFAAEDGKDPVFSRGGGGGGSAGGSDAALRAAFGLPPEKK